MAKTIEQRMAKLITKLNVMAYSPHLWGDEHFTVRDDICRALEMMEKAREEYKAAANKVATTGDVSKMLDEFAVDELNKAYADVGRDQDVTRQAAVCQYVYDKQHMPSAQRFLNNNGQFNASNPSMASGMRVADPLDDSKWNTVKMPSIEWAYSQVGQVMNDIYHCSKCDAVFGAMSLNEARVKHICPKDDKK